MSTKITFDPDGDVCLQLQSYTNATNVSWESLGIPKATSHDPAQPHNDTRPDVDGTRTAIDDPVLHLIVSSKVLSIASPIFKRMFNGGFKEAKDLAACQVAGRVYTLDLPEDDPLATLILCNILHPGSSTEHVPDPPGSATLEQLAILVDKYQCPKVLGNVGRLWLSCDVHGVIKDISQPLLSWALELRLDQTRPGAHYQVKELVQCLLFAYIVDLPFEYANIASVVVQVTNEAWLEEAFQSSLSHHLKHQLLETLRRDREHCCLRLYKAMREPRSWLAEVQTLSEATKLAAKVLAFEEVLVAKSLWFSLDEMSTVRVQPLADLIIQIWWTDGEWRTADGLKSLPPSARNLWKLLYYAATQVISRTPRTMPRSARNANWCDKTVTCCLDCLKTDNVSHSRGACRVPHQRDVLEIIENSETDFDNFANRVFANIQKGVDKEQDNGVEAGDEIESGDGVEAGDRVEEDDRVEAEDGVDGDQVTDIDWWKNREMSWSQVTNVGDSDYQDLLDDEEE